jgi:hypothetical protein
MSRHVPKFCNIQSNGFPIFLPDLELATRPDTPRSVPPLSPCRLPPLADLLLLGRSPRAVGSRWVNIERNLEPVAPGGPARRSSQREGFNEKMRNVTLTMGKWEKVSV